MKRIISSCVALSSLFCMSLPAFAETEVENPEARSVVGVRVVSINSTGTTCTLNGAEINNPGPGKTYTVQCTRFVSGKSVGVGFGRWNSNGTYTQVGTGYFYNFGPGSTAKFTLSSSHTGKVFP